jgi:hypothetical protein
MSQHFDPGAFRLPVGMLVAAACVLAPAIALARDATLKDAIQCKDFKRKANGSWSAEDVSLSYGSGKNQMQLNLFGPTTIAKGQTFDGVDLWGLLNEKCGAGQK